MTSEFARATSDDVQLAMLVALLDGDVALAYRLSTDLLSEGVSFDEIVIDLLGPVQSEIGRRWAAGDLSIADEHAASAAMEELVIRLGTIVEPATGPLVVVASAEHEGHSLGARIVAISLSLDGFRVLFLGASVPAEDLRDFLELREPFALALSCSTASALVGAAASVVAAHALGIPVVAGGRALAQHSRSVRLGVDALALVPSDAVECLHAWMLEPPSELAAGPDPVPERAELARCNHALIAAALAGAEHLTARSDGLGQEIARLLQVIEGALLLDEPGLVTEQVEWLRLSGPGRGFSSEAADAALGALASELNGDLERAGAQLRAALG